MTPTNKKPLSANKDQPSLLFYLNLYDKSDGKNISNRFPIGQDTLSIGRKDTDIVLQDPSVSRQHALVTFVDGEINVKDLGSRNGTLINGKKISQGKLVSGDVLYIGNVKLKIESTFDEDKTVASLTKEINEDQKKSSNIGYNRPYKTVMVDGEHCNIIFDDQSFHPTSALKTLSWNLKGRDYVDIFDQKYTGDIIAKRPSENAIEIITAVGGTVISVEYLPLKNGTYYVDRESSNRKVLALPCLIDRKKYPFLEVFSGEAGVLEVPGLEMRNLDGNGRRSGVLKGRQQLSKGHSIVLEQGVNQLFVRYFSSPPFLKKAPFFSIDKEDIKMLSYSTMILIVMGLITSFFDSRIPEPEEKQVSVVHRIRPKPKIKEPPKPKPKPKKRKTQPKAEAKSTLDSKKVTQALKRPKKTSKTVTKKQKNIKKEGRIPKRVRKKIAKKKSTLSSKSYNFSKSTASKLKNLFKKNSATGAPRIVKNTSIDSQSFSKVREVSGKGRGVSSMRRSSFGKLGDGYRGEYDLSEGSSGLSSKGRIDRFSYESPQVLIKGGIDFNAVRRILKELVPQMRYCYQRELARNSRVQGVFQLMFRITASGQAVNIKVEGSKSSFTKEGTKCLANALQRAVFPKPKGGGVVDIVQPLDFSKD